MQLDLDNGVPRPLPEQEKLAYEHLAQRVPSTSAPVQATVTGPLNKTEAGFVLQVRVFK